MRRDRSKIHIVHNFGLTIFSIVILSQLYLTAPLAHAQTTTVSTVPSSITAFVGQSFDINVTVSDVSNLYGWEIRVSWDVNLLNVTSVVEGPFLKAGGSTFFYDNLNLTTGNMVVDCALLGLVPGVSGSGTLSTITFYVENAGQGPLNLYNVTLVDPYDNEISAAVTGSYGYFNFAQDLAITGIGISPTVCLPGTIVNINVAVVNQGTSAETFNTTVFAGAVIIGFNFNYTLSSNSSTTIPFSWNTAGLGFGDYTISASVSIVPGEVNTVNNNMIASNAVTLLYDGHDVAVTSMNSPKTVVGQGWCAWITSTVQDFGVYSETFNTTIYVNATVIRIQTLSLQSGASATLTSLWNTTGFAMGIYQLMCVAQQVPGQTDTSNNTLTGGFLTVSLKGDISGTVPFVPDGIVDMRDVSAVAHCFGTHAGDSRWNANADVSGSLIGLPDGTIDMRDVAAVARYFGT